MATNYVKFLRGSVKAYQAKVDAGAIDENTLYFVYENKEAKTGQLYLGSKLLSGGGSDVSQASINDLKDIVINEVGDKQILVYNEVLNAWTNKSIYDAIEAMVGASATVDGASGLVPAPKKGDQNKVLRGDGTWQNEFINSLDDGNFSVVDGKLGLADGKSLVNETDRKKLNDLVISEDGKIELSGKVSAANVEGLQELLDVKANKEDVEKVSGVVGDNSKLVDHRTEEEKIADGTEKPTLVQSINNIYNMLTWEDLDSPFYGLKKVEMAPEASVADALATLPENEVLVLPENEVIADNLIIGENAKIDANGSTFSGDLNVAGSAIIENAVFTGKVVVG